LPQEQAGALGADLQFHHSRILTRDNNYRSSSVRGRLSRFSSVRLPHSSSVSAFRVLLSPEGGGGVFSNDAMMFTWIFLNEVITFHALSEAAHVKRIRFHGLRHTCASLMLEAGEAVKIIQERLGLATILITMDTYAHLQPTTQKHAASRLNALLHS